MRFLRLSYSLLLGLPLLCAAATYTWTGGSGSNANWSGSGSSANWSSAPSASNTTDTLVFGTGSASGTSPNANAAFSFGTLQFGGTSTSYSIIGSTLTVYSGITQLATATANESISNAITLGGSSVTYQNSSSKTLTLSGTTALNNKSLTISSGPVTVGAFSGSGTVTVGSGASLAIANGFTDTSMNVSLGGGSLLLTGDTYTIGNLTLTANSTIDFGSSSASVLKVNGTLNLAGYSLTVLGWSNSSTAFYASTFTGATLGTVGSTVEKEINFSGWSSWQANTWDSSGYLHTVPVPEASDYGLLLSASLAALPAFRAWRCRRKAALPPA